MINSQQADPEEGLQDRKPLEPAEPTLQQKTMRGLGWSTASTVANAAMQIGYSATIARLVDLSSLGIVAASGNILRFGGYFAEMGFGKALIQKEKLEDNDIRAAFTGYMVLGLVIGAIFFFAAPLIAPIFLDDENLIPILRFQSLGFLTSGLAATPMSLLRRKMDFATIAKLELVGYILGYGGVGVGLAATGYGVWGYAAAGMASQVFMGLLGYWAVRHSLKPIFDFGAYRPMLGYGGRVSIISFIEYLSSNADSFVIGKRLGSEILAFYRQAQNLVQLPIYNLTQAMSRVLFPAMSSIQNDIPRLRRVYLGSITLLGFLIIPVGMGLSVAGREAILTVLGPKFEPAVPILQILAVMTPFRLLTYFSGLICDSTGNLNVKIRTEAGFMVVYGLSSYLVAPYYGVIGVSFAIMAGELLRFSVYIFILKGILHYNIADLLKGYIPALLTAVCVALTIYLAHIALPSSVLAVPIIALLIEGAAGGLGLALGLVAPWSRPVRRQVYDRFLSKSSFGAGRLGQMFVNL